MYYQTSYQSPKISPYVKGIIIANVAVFVVQLIPYIGDFVTRYGAMEAKAALGGGQVWRLVSYMFLHSPDMIFHILFNMLMLWWFGTELEDLWGGKKFLSFYIICGTGAGLFSLVHLFLPQYIYIIGASGAVLAVLTAYAYYYPDRRVLLFFIIPVKVRTLVIGYALFSVFFTLTGRRDGISHLTHLGGILVAWLYLKYFTQIRATIVRRFYEWKNRMRLSATARDTYRNKRFELQYLDPILAKISQSGMESLTAKEKRILKNASRARKGGG